MLAIIPAKKKSRRLPNKNIKLFSKKPLIAHTIKCALKSKYITRVIVSTDSVKIGKIAIKQGAEVPFLRSKSLTRDKVTTWEVCKNVIEKLKKIEKKEGFDESILSNKDNNKIPFFYLGPKNDWKKILKKEIQDDLEKNFQESLKDLDYL